MKPASPSAEPQPKLEEIKQEEQTLQTVPVSSSDSIGGFNSSTETDGAPPPPPPAVLNVPVIIPTASVNNSGRFSWEMTWHSFNPILTLYCMWSLHM